MRRSDWLRGITRWNLPTVGKEGGCGFTTICEPGCKNKRHQPDAVRRHTPHLYYGANTSEARDTRSHFRPEENVLHSADSKENLLPANQKDYFIKPHVNRNKPNSPQPPPPSPPPSPFLSPLVTYSMKCGRDLHCTSAEFCYFSLLSGDCATNGSRGRVCVWFCDDS